jgi:hypothetical protein
MNLSNLDPNLVTGLVTLLGTLAAWGYHKARGTKQRDLTELLDDAITAEVEDALDDGETLDTIEDRLTQAGMALAKKLGLKVGEGTLRVDLAAAADKVNDAFTPSGTFPKLGG